MDYHTSCFASAREVVFQAKICGTMNLWCLVITIFSRFTICVSLTAMSPIVGKGISNGASSSETAGTDLLPTIRNVFPSCSNYEVIAKIEQSSAIGYKVVVDIPKEDGLQQEECSEKEGDVDKKTIFIKHVEVDYYVPKKKDWSDLRRSILYARNEVRFYNEFVPFLKELTCLPRVHYAHVDLSGWLEDDEPASCTETINNPPVLWQTRNEEKQDEPVESSSSSWKGGTLVMECISEETHYQESPLSLREAKMCLGAAAQLHASAWENAKLLENAKERLSLASVHLSLRNPKEVQSLVDGWENFRQAFADHLPPHLAESDLGKRTYKHAELLSSLLSPKPNDPYATIIHGDYKSLNTFLPESGNENDVIMVDYASTGIGIGMCDVAMHVHHAVKPEDLDNGGEMELVNYYIKALQSRLPDGDSSYPDDVAMKHYKAAVLDYFRFFLGRFWKSATPKSLAQKKDNKNVNLINRDIPSAMAFVQRVETYLTEFEKEHS